MTLLARCALGALTLLFCLPVQAGLTQRSGAAVFDWSDLRLSATVRGEPDHAARDLSEGRNAARRDAENEAHEALEKTFLSLPLSEGQTLGMIFKQHPNLETLLHRGSREYVVKDEIYYSNGAVDLSVEMPLTELLAKVLTTLDGSTAKSPAAKGVKKDSYSGLIIDTQGLVFYPVLAPTLLAEDRRVLYSRKLVSTAALAKRGVVGYYAQVEDAKASGRVGKQPLVIRALRLESRDSLVLPSHAVRALQESNLDLSFLEEGRVALVIPSFRPS